VFDNVGCLSEILNSKHGTPKYPDRHWSPPNLLLNGQRGLYPWE